MEKRKVLMKISHIRQLYYYLDLLVEIFESLVYEYGNEHITNMVTVTNLKFVIINPNYPARSNKIEVPLNENQVGLLFFLLDLLEQTLCSLDPKTTKQGDVIAHHLYKIILLKDVISEFYAEDLANL